MPNFYLADRSYLTSIGSDGNQVIFIGFFKPTEVIQKMRTFVVQPIRRWKLINFCYKTEFTTGSCANS
jgi:hypothetical protein